MLNISLTGVDHRFGSYGGYSGRNATILSSVHIDRKLWHF